MRESANAIQISGFGLQSEPAFSATVTSPVYAPQRLPPFCCMAPKISAMKKWSQFNLDAECNFRGLPPQELETACKYEYMRESQALRQAMRCCDSAKKKEQSTAVPFFQDEMFTRGERYRLAVALREFGFPKPWRNLKKNARKKLVKLIREWDAERRKSYPPIVIEEATAERDLQRELASPIWKLTPLRQQKPEMGTDVEARLWRPAQAAPGEPELLHSGQQSNRKYLYGFIRIDQSYNQTEMAKAFREWLGNRWQRSKSGGGRHWQSLLNQLAVMRIWKVKTTNGGD